MSVIDLSRLPAPTLVTVDYQAIKAARLASLKARLESAGLPYDVETIESDWGPVLQEEDGTRQMLDLQAINDMAKALTLGYSKGADLDRLAATFYADLGLERMDGELDDRFERRILLAAEALAGALTAGGIEYRALAYDLRIIDAVAYEVGRGTNRCVLLIEDGAPAEAIRAGVLARLREPKLRGTAELAVSLARPIEARLSVRLQHGRGPDPELLKAESLKALGAVKARVERKIAAPLTTDEIIAEGRVGGVSKLILDEPAADLIPGRDGVLRIVGIDVRTELAS